MERNQESGSEAFLEKVAELGVTWNGMESRSEAFLGAFSGLA
jgi:hypothetical protein